MQMSKSSQTLKKLPYCTGEDNDNSLAFKKIFRDTGTKITGTPDGKCLVA
jgi:hypothetical protein